MKKLLASIASVTLMVTPTISVVSCFGSPNKEVELDYWDDQRYTQELDDLKYEKVDVDSSGNIGYNLTSKKLGLDFTIKEHERSGKNYAITNKSIRVGNLDINNYKESDVVDSFAAFAEVESQLPDSKTLYEDRYVESVDNQYDIVGVVEAEFLNSDGSMESNDPLFKKRFCFGILEASIPWFFYSKFTEAKKYWNQEEIKYIFEEPKPIDEIEEILWKEVILRGINRMTNNEKQIKDFYEHFKKYASIKMDENYNPMDWQGDENNNWYQALNNFFKYSFEGNETEFQLWISVKTNQKEATKPTGDNL